MSFSKEKRKQALDGLRNLEESNKVLKNTDSGFNSDDWAMGSFEEEQRRIKSLNLPEDVSYQIEKTQSEYSYLFDIKQALDNIKSIKEMEGFNLLDVKERKMICEIVPPCNTDDLYIQSDNSKEESLGRKLPKGSSNIGLIIDDLNPDSIDDPNKEPPSNTQKQIDKYNNEIYQTMKDIIKEGGEENLFLVDGDKIYFKDKNGDKINLDCTFGEQTNCALTENNWESVFGQNFEDFFSDKINGEDTTMVGIMYEKIYNLIKRREIELEWLAEKKRRATSGESGKLTFAAWCQERQYDLIGIMSGTLVTYLSNNLELGLVVGGGVKQVVDNYRNDRRDINSIKTTLAIATTVVSIKQAYKQLKDFNDNYVDIGGVFKGDQNTKMQQKNELLNNLTDVELEKLKDQFPDDLSFQKAILGGPGDLNQLKGLVNKSRKELIKDIIRKDDPRIKQLRENILDGETSEDDIEKKLNEFSPKEISEKLKKITKFKKIIDKRRGVEESSERKARMGFIDDMEDDKMEDKYQDKINKLINKDIRKERLEQRKFRLPKQIGVSDEEAAKSAKRDEKIQKNQEELINKLIRQEVRQDRIDSRNVKSEGVSDEEAAKEAAKDAKWALKMKKRLERFIREEFKQDRIDGRRTDFEGISDAEAAQNAKLDAQNEAARLKRLEEITNQPQVKRPPAPSKPTPAPPKPTPAPSKPTPAPPKPTPAPSKPTPAPPKPTPAPSKPTPAPPKPTPAPSKPTPAPPKPKRHRLKTMSTDEHEGKKGWTGQDREDRLASKREYIHKQLFPEGEEIDEEIRKRNHRLIERLAERLVANDQKNIAVVKFGLGTNIRRIEAALQGAGTTADTKNKEHTGIGLTGDSGIEANVQQLIDATAAVKRHEYDLNQGAKNTIMAASVAASGAAVGAAIVGTGGLAGVALAAGGAAAGAAAGTAASSATTTIIREIHAHSDERHNKDAAEKAKEQGKLAGEVVATVTTSFVTGGMNAESLKKAATRIGVRKLNENVADKLKDILGDDRAEILAAAVTGAVLNHGDGAQKSIEGAFKAGAVAAAAVGVGEAAEYVGEKAGLDTNVVTGLKAAAKTATQTVINDQMDRQPETDEQKNTQTTIEGTATRNRVYGKEFKVETQVNPKEAFKDLDMTSAQQNTFLDKKVTTTTTGGSQEIKHLKDSKALYTYLYNINKTNKNPKYKEYKKTARKYNSELKLKQEQYGGEKSPDLISIYLFYFKALTKLREMTPNSKHGTLPQMYDLFKYTFPVAITEEIKYKVLCQSKEGKDNMDYIINQKINTFILANGGIPKSTISLKGFLSYNTLLEIDDKVYSKVIDFMLLGN